MKELSEFVQRMLREVPGEYESMPDIGLYMDQVLAFLARKRVSMREGDNLTSAMINNYIKAGLVPRANGKKYGKEHLVSLDIVARLKQILSVKDMTALLKEVGESSSVEEQYEQFRTVLRSAFQSIDSSMSEEDLAGVALELALSGYACKIASEYLIDLMQDRKMHPNGQGAIARYERTEKIKSAAARADEVQAQQKTK